MELECVYYFEDSVVENDHDYRGNVERCHGRVDEKLFVVERALVDVSIGRVVEAAHDWRRHGHADHPHERDCDVGAVHVFVARVF